MDMRIGLRRMGAAVAIACMACLTSCLGPQITSAPPPVVKPDFPGRYAEFMSSGESPLVEKYHYTLTRKENRYVYRRFFPETYAMTLYQEYADEEMQVRDGIHEEFWDDGSPKGLGGYTRDSMTGYWEYYHPNGNLREEGAYWDNARDGSWKSYYVAGPLESESNYAAGLLDGKQIQYDSLGNVTDVEWYEMGEEVEGGNAGDFAYGLEPGVRPPNDTFTVVEKFPLLPGCPDRLNYAQKKPCADRKLLQFLYSTLRYPAEARRFGVTGSAMVSFVIEADGSLAEVKVLSGLCQSITEELERVVSLMPDWIPGEQDGKKVRVQFNLPVDFSL